MKRTKVCIIGHFGFGETLLNGQTVKTKIIAGELTSRFGESEVNKLDTRFGKRNLLAMVFKTARALKNCDDLVMLPAHNGIRFFAPILNFWNYFYRRRLHYAVIGNWLPDMLKKRRSLARKLKKFTTVAVETETAHKTLLAMGFNNLIVMPNCKELVAIDKGSLQINTVEPYKLCTFSRVNAKKGIEDAIEAVKAANERAGREFYTLDIYGQIENEYKERFCELQKGFPPFISYKGQIDFDKSVDTLKDYTALLFPTQYYTEGVPGTVIDAYAAGVPVISSRWESFEDVIADNKTGIGYEFGKNEQLTEILCGYDKTIELLSSYKANCIDAYENYSPNKVLNKLIERMGK